MNAQLAALWELGWVRAIALLVVGLAVLRFASRVARRRLVALGNPHLGLLIERLMTTTGAAMVVLPGGGYAAVAMDLEGTEICDWITKQGVTCVLLKYRVPQVWPRDGRGGGRFPLERGFTEHRQCRPLGARRGRLAQ